MKVKPTNVDDVTELKSQVGALKNQIALLTASMCLKTAITGIELPSLGMNTPNPFSSKTVINYSLPSSFSNSAFYIYVSDASGNLLKKYRIQYAGKGNIAVGDLANLSSGTYLYSLEIDGKIYDTKMMILAK